MKALMAFFFFGSMHCFSSAQAPMLSWVKGIGGTADDQGYAITGDAYGYIYTTGIFKGNVSFGVNIDSFNFNSAGGSDIFVMKMNADGGVIWASPMGGGLDDAGRSIASDAEGNTVCSGFFIGSADFNPGAPDDILNSNGAKDAFIVKLDFNGHFKWACSVGGTDNDYSTSVGIDTAGNVYMAGIFNGQIDLDPGAGTSLHTSAGSNDIFIIKLDSAGNYLWGNIFGGPFGDAVNGMQVSKDGRSILLTGSFDGSVDFNPAPNQSFFLTSEGYDDAFLIKLNSKGEFLWAECWGGSQTDIAYAIATDDAGHIFVSGEYQGPVDFNPGAEKFYRSSVAGSHDIFISKLDSNGQFIWTGSMGGNDDNDHAFALACDAEGNVYATGIFSGTADFDPGNGQTELTALGSYEMFLCHLKANGTYGWAGTLRNTQFNYGASLFSDMKGHLMATGYFAGTCDFDPGNGNHELSSAGRSDVFIMKMNTDATGLSRLAAKPTVKIYPNPSSGQIHIVLPDDFKIISFEILNAQGQNVWQNNTQDLKEDIDISCLTTGVYQIRITGLHNGQSSIFTTKLILTPYSP